MCTTSDIVPYPPPTSWSHHNHPYLNHHYHHHYVLAAPAPVIKKKAKVVKAKASKGKVAKASKGKKAAKDDKPKVKRAPGPYMIFCKAERPKIVKANPSMAFGEMGKALGAAWGKLSDAQKAKFKN